MKKVCIVKYEPLIHAGRLCQQIEHMNNANSFKTPGACFTLDYNF